MTGNTLLTKIKTKIILALIIVGLLCTSLFVLTACSEDDTTEIPSYSYTDTDDGLISNPNFNYNTSSIELENFPQTSPTGWSRSKDTDGKSSSAKSGVVDISEEGWKAYLNTIYSDSHYLGYLENKLNFSKTDIEEANADLSEDEIKAKVVEAYSSILTAPTKANATDSKVYMLNNYNSSEINFGSSQKITSSKAITINKGEYVQITVDVYTQSIKDASSKEILGLNGANGKFGASIRLANTFNSSSQAEYAITNINTDGKWETYTLYAKGDDRFDCSVTLALGLGYSNEYPTEGTVFFDNITVEQITAEELAEKQITLPTATTLTYGETKANVVEAGATKIFAYDMSLSTPTNYFSDVDLSSVSGEQVKLNNDGTKTTSTVAPTVDATAKTIKVENLASASYTLKIEDATNFKVSREEYKYIEFKLDNDLNKFSSTSVTVDVFDNSTGEPLKNKHAAIASITETGEAIVGVLVKNNFDKDDDAYSTQDDKSFYIEIVVGPTVTTSSDKLSDYANGSITISELKIAGGKSYQYEDNGDETDNYKFYSLFSGLANGTTSLYAGYSADYSENNNSEVSTGFGIAASDKSYLATRPVIASDYNGVSYDHIYLKSDSENSKNNERVAGIADGSFAGVVDTQYIDGYSVPASNKTAIQNNLAGEEKTRALMIYNAKADGDSYGFISNSDAHVIAANSFAKISVKVKVDATAKAYIYLVDTDTKEIMTFDDFTPNSNGLTAISNAQEISGEEFKFEVGNTNGEWVDVVFYIATGKAQKSFRIELWNGSRDGASKSTGYVFFKSAEISLSNAFSEPASFNESFTAANSPLYSKEASFVGADGKLLYACYSRPLTDIEKEFNEEYEDKAISYSPKIIWAKNDTMIYAIFNTIDVEYTDPYDSITEEETEEEESGCAAETDPATFWLSFSSILLVVVLVLAIVALIIKNVRRRRKARASDAKSHYTVKSRVRTVPKHKKAETAKAEEVEEEQEITETSDVEAEEELEATEEVQEETASEEEKEQTLDEYVYGDVQAFGEETETNEDKESE